MSVNILSGMLTPGTFPPFALALANHLWQSTWVVGVAGLLTLTLRRNHARARYGLWLAASMKFLVPFSLLMMLGGQLGSLRHSATQRDRAAESLVAIEQMSQPFTNVPYLSAAPRATVPATSISDRLAAMWNREPVLPLAVAAAWLVGFVFVVARWTRRWRRISAAIQLTTPLREGREFEVLQRMERLAGLRRGIELRSLPASMEPGIFGIFRPVLMWPQAITVRLEDAHLEAVLAHEVCHVRRRDNLTAAMHMVVEAIFWFHPGVWWLERRLVEEREHACDEEVLQMCGERGIYAESILKVCEFCVETPLACVSGVTGADLKRRIVQILAGRTVLKLTFAKKLLLTTTALLVIAVPIVLGQADGAQRMMMAAVDAAPRPFRAAAHAMMAEKETPSKGWIAIAEMEPAPVTHDVAPHAESSQVRQPEYPWFSPEPTIVPQEPVSPHGIRMIPVQLPDAPVTLSSVGFSTEDWFNGGRIQNKTGLRVEMYRIGWAYALPNGLEFHRGDFEITSDAPQPRGSAAIPAQHATVQPAAKDFIYFVDYVYLSNGSRWVADHKKIETYYADHFANGGINDVQARPDAASGITYVALVHGSPVPQASSPLAFDSVSVRPNRTMDAHPGPMIHRDGFMGLNITLQWAMWYAYGDDGRRKDYFAGLPEWVKSERFDIVATVSTENVESWISLTEPERERLVRAMLEDQFKMKIHPSDDGRSLVVDGVERPSE